MPNSIKLLSLLEKQDNNTLIYSSNTIWVGIPINSREAKLLDLKDPKKFVTFMAINTNLMILNSEAVFALDDEDFTTRSRIS